MKRIIYLLLLLCITSCSKWFDVTPKSEIGAEELFETKAGFADALIGIYIGMTSDDAYGQNMTWEMPEFLACTYVGGSSALFNQWQRYNYEYSMVKSVAAETWAKLYNIVAEINYLLKMLDEKGSILDPVEYNVYKGEALALRAYIHLDLIRLYGKANAPSNELAIPYLLEYSKVIPHQSTYEEYYANLNKDIADALELLKVDTEYPFDDAFRPSSYDDITSTNTFFMDKGIYMNREVHMGYMPTQLLQARAYMWQGEKEKALEASEKCIAAFDILVTNDVKTWANESGYVGSSSESYEDKLFYGECLFVIDVTKLSEYMEVVYDNHINGTWNYGRLIQEDAFIDGIYNVSGGEAASDIRFLYQYEASNFADEKLTTKINKYEGYYYYNKIPLMRIFEAYLISAECMVGSNNAKAIEYLNLMKQKRKIISTYFISADATEEAIEEAIFTEYRKEFIQEGQLFYFYKRKAYSTFPGCIHIGGMTDEQYVTPMPDIEIELGQRN